MSEEVRPVFQSAVLRQQELTHGPLGRVVAQVQKVAIEVATTAMGAHDIEKDVRGLRTRWRAGGGVGTTR